MPYDSFTGVQEYANAYLNQNLRWSLAAFLNWSFLNIGGFDNITLNVVAPYGGRNDQLKMVHDPYYTDGCVWQAFRHNWVWETGINYTYQPINISGVYLNNQFYNISTTGTYQYILDYPNGRVIFNNPQTGNLYMEYSYRNVYVCSANESWFKEVMYTSYRSDDWKFAVGSGIYQTIGNSRVQLPAVVIELVDNRQFKGYGLGGGHYVKQDVILHVIAENEFDRDNLVDILSFQADKTLYISNLNTLISNNKLPLDANGSRVSGFLNYSQILTNPYLAGKLIIENPTTQKIGAISQSLYGGQVRFTANCMGIV